MAIKRGEIYFVNLNPVKGREQAGGSCSSVIQLPPLHLNPLVPALVFGDFDQGGELKMCPKDHRVCFGGSF